MERHFDGEMLADDAAQQSLHVGQQMIYVDQLGLRRLSAAKGKQLSGERGCPISGIQDLF
jgi:hypothetical protein